MGAQILLPPTPKPSRTLDEFKQAVSVWTREAEKTIRKISAVADASQPAGAYLLDAPLDGTIYGRKNGAWVAAGGSTTSGNLTEITSSILAIVGGTGAVLGTGTTIQVRQASGSQGGYLSSTDWTTFNGKQSALTLGNFTEITSAVLTISGGVGAIIGSGLTVQVKQASGSQGGYLSSTDWTTFNGKLDKIKATKAVVLCENYTPALGGADTGEIAMPFATDGTSLTYSVVRLSLRVGVAGGAPSVLIEKSTASGAFSAATVGTVTLAGGANEGNVTSALGTVASGDKLRFNAVTLGTAQYWTVTVEIAPP